MSLTESNIVYPAPLEGKGVLKNHKIVRIVTGQTTHLLTDNQGKLAALAKIVTPLVLEPVTELIVGPDGDVYAGSVCLGKGVELSRRIPGRNVILTKYSIHGPNKDNIKDSTWGASVTVGEAYEATGIHQTLFGGDEEEEEYAYSGILYHRSFDPNSLLRNQGPFFVLIRVFGDNSNSPLMQGSKIITSFNAIPLEGGVVFQETISLEEADRCLSETGFGAAPTGPHPLFSAAEAVIANSPTGETWLIESPQSRNRFNVRGGHFGTQAILRKALATKPTFCKGQNSPYRNALSLSEYVNGGITHYLGVTGGTVADNIKPRGKGKGKKPSDIRGGNRAQDLLNYLSEKNVMNPIPIDGNATKMPYSIGELRFNALCWYYFSLQPDIQKAFLDEWQKYDTKYDSLGIFIGTLAMEYRKGNRISEEVTAKYNRARLTSLMIRCSGIKTIDLTNVRPFVTEARRLLIMEDPTSVLTLIEATGV